MTTPADELARLQEVADGLRLLSGHFKGTFAILGDAASLLEAEHARAERLEAALRKYGRHSDGCGDMDAYNHAEVESCNCGLAAALAEPAPGGQDAERAVNAEGPPGSYGCKCTSRNALECARQAYYAGVEARERCGCLCHQWTDSGPWRCLTGDGR